MLRRVLFVVGWSIAGALAWAIVFGLALLVQSDQPGDFFEQATFRTTKVDAVAGAAVADGPCAEHKDGTGRRSPSGTSYRVDLTWTDTDGRQHDGLLSTCNRPDEGEHVTVWVTSSDAVFNRSPFAMYLSVPIAAAIFALGAGAWLWLTRDENRRRERGALSFGQRLRRRRLRRLRLRELKQQKKN
ncbi:hypothetical protein [Kribbella sp. NPDC048915]|uniref:hypothetical protein n=1 Tax=Kribbella sp. NPDC048915 TaxID=3155148 RepID=UPI0033C5873D